MWYGLSWKFHAFSVPNRRQFGRNWQQAPRLFHVMYPGFICFPCWNMTWILEKFKSWNFPGIYQENDGRFPSDLVSFSTKLPPKRHEKIRVTFFTGYPFSILTSTYFWAVGEYLQLIWLCACLKAIRTPGLGRGPSSKSSQWRNVFSVMVTPMTRTWNLGKHSSS